jgi:hypothetical protein
LRCKAVILNNCACPGLNRQLRQLRAGRCQLPGDGRRKSTRLLQRIHFKFPAPSAGLRKKLRQAFRSPFSAFIVIASRSVFFDDLVTAWGNRFRHRWAPLLSEHADSFNHAGRPNPCRYPELITG